MKLRKVLVLHKKSTFQLQAIEHRESRFVKLLEEGNEVVTRVKVAHNEHIETLEHVEKELKRRKIEYTTAARSEINERVSDVDLMISVGGDGTFLDASHYVTTVPILGVNSSESSSFGHFCQADEHNFAETLDQIEAETLGTSRLTRLELILNGQRLSDLVLNEILVAHENPAATSRHKITVNGVSEDQRSSGIWIGTASGSTGSIRSAGGKVLSIVDSHIQWIVREPCRRPTESWELERGMFDSNQTIKLVSEMRTGNIFVDGSHLSHPFYLGDELLVKASTMPLIAYVAPNINDIFL